MNRYVNISIILLLTSIMVISFAACSHGHHSPAKHGQWMVDRITSKLDLNDEQQNKLLAVKAEIETALKAHHQQKQQSYDSLLAEIKNPTLDKQLLLEMVQNRQKMIEQAAPGVIDKVIEFHASLSPEQKDKIAEHLQEYRDHWKEKHHL